ncbi:MAG TPA: ABC transporter permease [Thermoanaerobaculia bacterium]|nr:ABC transporter permease [Thermoanaerobaculia bacterium]
MKTFLEDLRYGVRMLLAAPAIYGAAVLSLALGVGANTAIFSVVNGVLLRPLPYRDADRLVMIWERDLKNSQLNRVDDLATGLMPMSVPNFFDYREQNKVFAGMVGMSSGNATVAAGGHDPTKVFGAGVFANFFETLGVHPVLGRSFLPVEEQAGRNRVVVLSYGLWEDAYGRDPGVLGKKFLMEGVEHTVVGVMPPGFEFPREARFWHPTGFPRDLAPRNFNFIRVFGRLKPGVSVATAQAAMATMARRLEQQYPDSLRNRGILLVPLKEQVIGQVRTRLSVLWGVVGLVLLIACANVTNLLLARANGRSREIAIRTALGARKRRLLRQLMTESLLLIVLGGGLGLLLALWGLRSLQHLAAGQIPRIETVGLDPAALLFTLVVSFAAGMLSGLVPALHAARPDLSEAFKEGGGRVAAGRSRRRLSRLMVVVQLAVAIVLVCGAGLLVKSFLHLTHVDPGFKPESVLAVEVTLPEVKYHDSYKTTAFFKELTARVDAMPGVRSAGFTFFLPMTGQSGTTPIEAEGAKPQPVNENKEVVVQAVTPGFFPTMGMALKQGRLLNDHDEAGAPEVVVVNEAAARRFWPNESPVGRKVTFAADFGPAGKLEKKPRQVVGVVGDSRYYGLDQSVEPEVYFPNYQSTWRWANLLVRAANDPLGLVPPIRQQLHNLDTDLAVGKIRTMEQLVSDSVAKPRFTTMLMLAFAAIALIMACVAVYGTVAYSVGQRAHEIAVRMAVGARHGDVVRLILGEGFVLGLTGLAIGLAGALALTRLMTSLLFEVSALDAAVFAGAFALLLALVVLASFLPARRAARVDPLIGLRAE